MRGSFLLSVLFVAGLSLPGCGARDSLQDPVVECGWSGSDGAANELRSVQGPFAVLDDGSVALSVGGVRQEDGEWTGDWRGLRVGRLERDGDIAWDGTPGIEAGRWSVAAVARDAAGRLFIGGALEPGVHSVMGAELSCPAESACPFVAMLGDAGAVAWSRVAPSETGGDAMPRDLVVSGDGRSAVLGDFRGTVDWGCGPLAGGAEGGESSSSYLVQLSPSGECLWSRVIVSQAHGSYSADLAGNDQGEVALALALDPRPGAQSIDLGGGPMPFDTEMGAGFAVAKYAADGALVFGKVAAGDIVIVEYEGGSPGNGVNVALTGAGEMLVSGGLAGTIDLGGGPRGEPARIRDFVTRLDANGGELWTRDLAVAPKLWENEVPYIIGASNVPFAIAMRPGGGFFLAGLGRPGMSMLGVPTPRSTLFVAEFDDGGDPLDVRTFASRGSSSLGNASLAGLEPSADGAVVVAGSFEGELDFEQELLVSRGVRDAFVARICR